MVVVGVNYIYFFYIFPRFERVQKRKEKKVQLNAAEALLDLSELPSSITDSTDTADEDEGGEITLDNMRQEYQRLLSENMALKQRVNDLEISQCSFQDNEAKVQFYTGLPSFVTLMAVFSFISEDLSQGTMSKLSKFQKYIMVLMKPRLNLPVQDLAYRFGVSATCVSKTFKTTLHVMYVKLRKFILWPTREELRKTMPLSFREHFGVKVVCIIDCFELFSERPKNLLARAQTWSNYKHMNTVKYLIGVCPQGVVSFISKGWGGRTSDKHITEKSGFLDKLLPGDVVLADRGFDVRDSVGLMCAEVKIPAFTRGKKQLSACDVETTRKIAHSRVHVERLIGLVKNKYSILQKGKLPIDILMSEDDGAPSIDKIVTVSCVLSNFCESIVPFS